MRIAKDHLATLALSCLVAIAAIAVAANRSAAQTGGVALAARGAVDGSSGGADQKAEACVSPGDPDAEAKAAAGLPVCAGSASQPAGGAGESLGPRGAVAAGAGTTPAQAAAIARLGVSSRELAALRDRQSAGELGSDDIQQLCLHLAARQIAPGDVGAIIGALGLDLSGEQLAQLRRCPKLGASAAEDAGSASAANQAAVAHGSRPAQVSSIETSFRALDSGARLEVPSATDLTQFGYSLFEQGAATQRASDVPVGTSYVIGPGDELRLILWGRINNTLTLTVGRDGSVAIPEIGPLQIAGLTFEQAKELIEGRAGQITGVKVDVTMGRLRTIQVFVVGEVARPGAYQVSALSHVANAIEAAGGITKIGTLRHIELRRGNQIAKVIDLYGLLLGGRIEGDIQLQPGDVIFVPVIGPVAAVVGDVKRPAIYELSRAHVPIAAVIRLAGGITAFGYSQRVEVERVENHRKRIVLDINLNRIGRRRFAVHDGDLVKVYPVLPAEHDVVIVRGNVNRPGKYQWRAGMRISDLIAAAEGVAPHTFFRYAMIRRAEGRAKSTRVVPIDLGKALSGDISSPQDLALERNDRLTVFSESQLKYLPTVQVLGEVRSPGYYVLSEGMRVSDLIYLAGGLRDDAYRKGAELARTQVIDGSHTSHTFMDVDLRAALDDSPSSDPLLQPDDQIFVRRATDWHLPWVVYVHGRVARPGPYTIREGERIASVLERCGGLLPNAYLPATVLIRQSVRRMQQERLDQARLRLKEAIARAQLNPGALTPASLESGGAGANSAALTALERVLGQSEREQAQGRLVIHLKPLDELAGSPDNVVMVDQDSLTIPRRPSSVNVLGQVYSPSAIVFRPGQTVRDYLDQAGGPSEGADPVHIMVIRADGSILTEDGIRASRESTMFPLLPMISGGLMASPVGPGDTIYVPEKLIYTNNLQVTATVTQIVSQTVMSLAVIGILATSL
jgi:protein involved in polysaccharide export with SLBB domain